MRMAQEGSACTSALQPAGVERSAATPRNSSFGMLALTPAMARSTSACVSPLTTTVAPHSARDSIRLRALGLCAAVIDVLNREIELVFMALGAAKLGAAIGQHAR